jgi:signal peptidase I
VRYRIISLLTLEQKAEEQGPELPAPEEIPARKERRSRWTWPRRALWAVGALLVIKTFIGEAALVPTSSMEGTILVGDHVLVNKIGYAAEIPFTRLTLPNLRSLHRGEIVAFQYPRDPKVTFVKRIVAVGGDTVEIRNDILYVNGMPVREPYVIHTRKRWLRSPENMEAREVPRSSVFVLGDNRDNSDDSRYWGYVPRENVIGEPLMVYWSYDAPSSAWLEKRPARLLAFYASIPVNLMSRTRWSRTGQRLQP